MRMAPLASGALKVEGDAPGRWVAEPEGCRPAGAPTRETRRRAKTEREESPRAHLQKRSTFPLARDLWSSKGCVRRGL